MEKEEKGEGGRGSEKGEREKGGGEGRTGEGRKGPPSWNDSVWLETHIKPHQFFLAEAIRTMVVPIRILIRTTVVPIRILIRTTECDGRSV